MQYAKNISIVAGTAAQQEESAKMCKIPEKRVHRFEESVR